MDPTVKDQTASEELVANRMAARLRRLGKKLVRNHRHHGGYGILVYNEDVGWIEAEGMSPIPYHLDLHDVISLTHDQSDT